MCCDPFPRPHAGDLICKILHQNNACSQQHYCFNITVIVHTSYCSCIFATTRQFIVCLIYCHKQSFTDKKLDTVNQQIKVAVKFGISQRKNDLVSIKFGMSPTSFLLILTFTPSVRADMFVADCD